MPIPLLEYSPSSQNQRVEGYEVPNEEQPYNYSTEMLGSGTEMDEAIWAAYRQIFSEHQALKSNRQRFLESRLRNGQITVRDFILGLVGSDVFRRLNYEPNSNYRFVEICIQRVLGRDVYNDREKIAWSIVLATKGLRGFVDDLINSEEYLQKFGEDIVPYQQRRILPQREEGVTPFNLQTPRYGAYYRQKLGFPQIVWQNEVRTFTPQEKKPQEGDPRQFLNMARGLSSAKRDEVPRVATMNINYENKVPYRSTAS